MNRRQVLKALGAIAAGTQLDFDSSLEALAELPLGFETKGKRLTSEDIDEFCQLTLDYLGDVRADIFRQSAQRYIGLADGRST